MNLKTGLTINGQPVVRNGQPGTGNLCAKNIQRPVVMVIHVLMGKLLQFHYFTQELALDGGKVRGIEKLLITAHRRQLDELALVELSRLFNDLGLPRLKKLGKTGLHWQHHNSPQGNEAPS